MEEVLYHGTERKKALNIIKTQTFQVIEDADNQRLLGTGAYFYFEKLDAYEWNVKEYRENNNKRFPEYKDMNDMYAIIETSILINNRNILDLDERNGIIKYKVIVKNIKQFLLGKEDYRDKNELSTIINLLYEKKMMNDTYAIEKTFPFPIPKSFGAKNIMKRMICIKKVDILKEFRMSQNINIEEYEKVKILYT